MRALNGADQLNGPRQWGSLLFYLVIVLSLQRAEGATEETGSSYTEFRILPNGGLAFFAYCTNYLIDLKRAVIVDVEATTALRQAEVTAQQRMIDRTKERFGLWPQRLAADAAYGSAENLAWLVHERGIEPHIPVFDNSQRTDGTYSRDDFTYDHKRDCYICPAGNELRQRQKIYRLPRPHMGVIRSRGFVPSFSPFVSDPKSEPSVIRPGLPVLVSTSHTVAA